MTREYEGIERRRREASINVQRTSNSLSWSVNCEVRIAEKSPG